MLHLDGLCELQTETSSEVMGLVETVQCQKSGLEMHGHYAVARSDGCTAEVRPQSKLKEC